MLLSCYGTTLSVPARPLQKRPLMTAFLRRHTPVLLALVAALAGASPASAGHRMPWADAGLTPEDAAAHLLDRFAFGATPALVEEVTALGLERWFSDQLALKGRTDALDQRLSRYTSLGLSNQEIVRLYPRGGAVRQDAMEAGYIDADGSEEAQRQGLRDYFEDMGYRPQRQIVGEAVAQRLVRAVHSPHPLEEVMVDFWYNHFYVSAADNQCRRFIYTYERDAIRPRVFATFGEMLEATAKHPAMLLYLDNAQSSAAEGSPTTLDLAKDEMRMRGQRYDQILDRMEKEAQRRRDRMMSMPEERRPRRGVNENYARELLELHTLGVEGGYDQADVEAVARALTGWTVVPEGERGQRLRERLARSGGMSDELGFVIAGDFFFNADAHDAGIKQILGRTFPAAGGLGEGEDVLDMLAHHPSTSRFIAYKLCVRFVSDAPPASVVDPVADRFRDSGGDLEALLWAVVESPDFWSAHARAAKIKSPFEVAVSAVRVLDGEVENPRQLARWVDRMGQPLYRYPAPTGFPDEASHWVNAGALLQRMNFGMALAMGRINGVRVEPGAVFGGREPESAAAALEACARALLPGREPALTVAVLEPMLARPDLAERIREKADSEDAGQSRAESSGMTGGHRDLAALEPDDVPATPAQARLDSVPLRQVIGLILGSPEFQRR